METQNSSNNTNNLMSQFKKAEKIPSISINEAYKIYKQGSIDVVALRGLSCNFYAGEITVIMGPSGCGKTTLLNMIGALDRLSSGKIYVQDTLKKEFFDLTKLTDKLLENYRRDRIGFVFQSLNLIPELNAFENIMLPIEFTKQVTPEQKKYIDEIITLIGMKERVQHRPDELSGGEQQRVGLATALANQSDIILCDEPTGELDSESKTSVMQILRKVIDTYHKKTMIIVTHDPEMKRIADRMYYIRDGHISHEFSPEELAQYKNNNSIEESKTLLIEAQKAKEKTLLELREIDHYLKSKIDKLEKDLHPQ